MKKKNLLVTIAISYCVIVGLVISGLYYEMNYAGEIISVLSFSLKNVLGSFTLSGDLGLSDIMDLKEMLVGMEAIPAFMRSAAFGSVMVSAYSVAMIVAPACTVAGILVSVELFLRKFVLHRRAINDGAIVIFGYGEDVKALTKKAKSLDIIASGEQEVSVLRDLDSRGIHYHEADLIDGDEAEIKDFLENLHLENASGILLMEKDDFTNLTLYIKLMESGIALKKDCRIVAECKEPLVGQLFKNYYNEKRCTPIRLFMQEDLAADALIRQYPVEAYAKEEESHFLVAGFGKTGQAVLNRILNEAVISADQKLYVDVIDRGKDTFREEFLVYLSGRFGKIEDNSIILETPDIDGRIEVHYIYMDLTSKSFPDYLKALPYTYDYAAVCLADAQAGIDTALKLNSISRIHGWENFPLLLVQNPGTETSKYIHANDGQYADIHYIEITNSLEGVFRVDEEQRAQKFNHIYNSLTISNEPLGTGSEGSKEPEKTEKEKLEAAESAWNSMDYYKQLSSRKSANHQRVKEYVLKKKYGDAYKDMIRERFGENGTILRKRGNIYLTDAANDEELVKKINADAFAREMAMLEHKRWNISMALDGWSYAEKKDVVRQETPYLTDWDTLCEKRPWAAVYDLMPVLYINQMENDEK